MAELLGVVASGVAVTQAAHAVGGVVFSLCRLWREVKDVPETIQNMLDELDLAGKLMAAVETELMGSASSTGPKVGGSLPSIQYLAIQRCHQVHKDLGGVIDDLSADIASSKRRKRLMAKTRVVLKKETLENYEKRLEKALRCLDSAIQLHLA